MIVLKFIGYISNLFIMKNTLLIIFFAFFIGYLLLFHFHNRDEEFDNSLKKILKILGISFASYAIFLLVFGIVGDFILFPIDAIFLTQLCCLIVFLVILLFDKILSYSRNNIFFMIESIIAFFGVWVSFTLLWIIPFSWMNYKGHAPFDFFYINLLFLLVATIFISIKNIFRKKRSKK